MDRLRLERIDFRVDLWHRFEQILDQAQISHMEDRRLRIFVDRHDRLRVFHAGQMLNGARYADGHVQFLFGEDSAVSFSCRFRRNLLSSLLLIEILNLRLAKLKGDPYQPDTILILSAQCLESITYWSHNLACLTDLQIVRNEAGVHGSSRRAHSGADLIGELVEYLEVLAALHAATAGDDLGGGGQFRAFALGQLGTNIGNQIALIELFDLLFGHIAALLIVLLERRLTYGQHLQVVLAFHRLDRIASVDVAPERVLVLNADHLADRRYVHDRRDSRQQVLSVDACTGQDVTVAVRSVQFQHCIGTENNT